MVAHNTKEFPLFYPIIILAFFSLSAVLRVDRVIVLKNEGSDDARLHQNPPGAMLFRNSTSNINGSNSNDHSNFTSTITGRTAVNFDNKTSISNDGPIAMNNSRHDPSLSCQRFCPKRSNIIYYAGAAAGLGDRKVILHDLSQLAGYLCAELIVPPPKELLSRDHNFGRLVSETVEWSDFVNITFVQDGSLAIRKERNESSGDDDDDGLSITSWSNKPAIMLNGSRYKDWLHVVSTDGKMKDDFEVIQRFSFEQTSTYNSSTGFVWEIHDKWYFFDIWSEPLPTLDSNKEYVGTAYRPKMRPFLATYFSYHSNKRRTGCIYTNPDTTPSDLVRMRKRLLKRIERHSPNNSIFGLLHLRRGDVASECDTSVERMRQYFACSLNGTETLGRNFTMLFTSDEEDLNYRQSIMQLIEEYPHVTILDADMIVQRIVREAVDHGIIKKGLDNNYYIYEVANIIRDWDSPFLKFHLVRRRSSICTECINLAKRLCNILDDCKSGA